MTENEYCIHEVETPTIDYQRRIYLSDGMVDYWVSGQWIDSAPCEIADYEDLIYEYYEEYLQDDDRYYTDLTIVIDDEDNITIEGL